MHVKSNKTFEIREGKPGENFTEVKLTDDRKLTIGRAGNDPLNKELQIIGNICQSAIYSSGKSLFNC